MPHANPLTRRAWNRWWAMIHRCTNPKDLAYKNYGGRGITICDRWLDFATYYADLGDAPPGLTLDRIDNDGDYEPGNVRWATPLEQTRNRRNSRPAKCPQGHEFTEANTYSPPSAPSSRSCRECNRVEKRRRRARSKLKTT